MSDHNEFKASDVLASLFSLAGQVCVGLIKLVGAVGYACYHVCNLFAEKNRTVENSASHEAD
jgi:hypothetical protein